MNTWVNNVHRKERTWTIGQDLYDKLVNNKISFRIFNSAKTKCELKRELIARLYLVNKGKGVLYYYPNNRGRYRIEEDNEKLEFYTMRI